MGEGATIVDTANVAQWLREGLMRNLGDGLKGIFANLQWTESEVPNRTLLDVSYPSFALIWVERVWSEMLRCFTNTD